MLANTCMWDYRGDECGYNGPAVADEFDNPTTDIRKDRCSKCMRRCEMRGMVANFGGFFPLTNFRSKSNDTDRISDSGARPAVCACGVVRLRGENAGGERYIPVCEYLCRAGGVFSYCTGRSLRAEMVGRLWHWSTVIPVVCSLLSEADRGCR